MICSKLKEPEKVALKKKCSAVETLSLHACFEWPQMNGQFLSNGQPKKMDRIWIELMISIGRAVLFFEHSSEHEIFCPFIMINWHPRGRMNLNLWSLQAWVSFDSQPKAQRIKKCIQKQRYENETRRWSPPSKNIFSAIEWTIEQIGAIFVSLLLCSESHRCVLLIAWGH